MAQEESHRDLATLRILYGSCSAALDALRASDNSIDDQLLADLETMVERAHGEIERLTARLASSAATETQETLYWKWEGVPPGAEQLTPADVGPAWVVEADGAERLINDGEWISRAEAEALAQAGGYIFDAEP